MEYKIRNGEFRPESSHFQPFGVMSLKGSKKSLPQMILAKFRISPKILSLLFTPELLFHRILNQP